MSCNNDFSRFNFDFDDDFFRFNRDFIDDFIRFNRDFVDDFSKRGDCRRLAREIKRIIRDIKEDAKRVDCKFDELKDNGCIRGVRSWDDCDDWNHCHKCCHRCCHKCCHH